jgi:hypothetical protein
MYVDLDNITFCYPSTLPPQPKPTSQHRFTSIYSRTQSSPVSISRPCTLPRLPEPHQSKPPNQPRCRIQKNRTYSQSRSTSPLLPSFLHTPALQHQLPPRPLVDISSWTRTRHSWSVSPNSFKGITDYSPVGCPNEFDQALEEFASEAVLSRLGFQGPDEAHPPGREKGTKSDPESWSAENGLRGT